MRGSVRQFALLLLTATYAVLWTCGSAWHLASCAHCDHASDDSAQAANGSHCCRSHAGDKRCSHSREHHVVGLVGEDGLSSGQKNGSPETPHDASDCEICQLFAQPLTFVAVVSLENSPERVESSVCLIPLTVPECELIPATSRGPPLIA